MLRTDCVRIELQERHSVAMDASCCAPNTHLSNLWRSRHYLEIFRKKIKLSVNCKGFGILRSETLLDLGYDLDCLVRDDSETLFILDWNPPLIVLYSLVISGVLVSRRAASPCSVNLCVRLFLPRSPDVTAWIRLGPASRL